MKQKLLLVSANKSFITSLQQTLNGDYSISVISPKIKQYLFTQEVKKTLYLKIIFIDTGEEEIRGLFTLIVLQMPWLCERIVFLTSLRQENEKFLKDTGCSTIAFYGDIISSIPDIDSLCNKLLLTAKEKNEITIESTGIRLYPVFLDDVVSAVRAMLFHTFDHTLFIFPQQEVTSLTLARIVQKIDPNIAINVGQEGDDESDDVFLPKHGKYMVDLFNFETKLKDVYTKISIQTNQPLDVITSRKDKKSSSYPSLFSGISLAMLTLLLFFPILASISLFSSLWALENEKSTVAKGFALFARDAFFVSEQTIGSIFKTAYFSLGKDSAEGVVLFSDVFSLFSQVARGDTLSNQELIYGLNLARRVAVIKQQMQTAYGVPNIFKTELGAFAREEQVLMAALD